MRTESEKGSKGSKVKPFIYHVRTYTFYEAGVLVVGRIALPVRYLHSLGFVVFAVLGAFIVPVLSPESSDAVVSRALGVGVGIAMYAAVNVVFKIIWQTWVGIRQASREVRDGVVG